MRNRIKFYILFILTFIISKGYSQLTYEVQFVTEDSINNSIIPVPSVTVIINELNIIQEANKEGIIIFNNLQKEELTLSAFSESFEPKIWAINLNKETKDTIHLQALTIKLTEVQIKAKRKEIFAIKKMQDIVGTSLYAGKKNEVVVMDLVEGNLASNKGRQVYAQVTGLNIYEGSDGGLQLSIGGRGLDPSRTANFNTRQNGYDISADVLGYPENYYTPPSEAISEIQILRGASSLQYGTQFGGLINFKLKEIPISKTLEIESNQTIGSFNFLNTFNRVGLNKGKLSSNFILNYKRGDGFRDHSKFSSINCIGNLTYKLTKKIKLKAEFTFFDYLAAQAGGLTDSQFLANPDQSTRNRNWFDVNWKLYNLLYSHEISKNSKLSISIFHLNAIRSSVGFRGNPIALNENPITGLDEQNIEGEYIYPRDLISDRFNNYGIESKYIITKEIGNRKTVLLIGSKYFQSQNTSFQGAGSNGIEANFDSFNSIYPDYPNQSTFIFPNQNISFFTEQIFYLTDKISIVPGIRYEFIRTQAKGSYQQVTYDIAGNPINTEILNENRNIPRNFLLFGLGSTFQVNKSIKLNANISQNYRSVTFSDIRVTSPGYIVDPEIKDESGFTTDFNMTGRLKKILSYDLGLFSIYYNDRIGIILDDRANRVRKNIGSAVIGGVESLVDVNLLELVQDMNSNYQCNFFINSAVTYSRYLTSEQNNVVGNKVEFIPLVNLKTGLSTGYKNFGLSLQYTYISKQFTDVQNSGIGATGSTSEGLIGEIPSYKIWDLTSSYSYKNFKFTGGINNFTNSRYYTRRATGYPGPGIIPSEPISFFFTVNYTY